MYNNIDNYKAKSMVHGNRDMNTLCETEMDLLA